MEVFLEFIILESLCPEISKAVTAYKQFPMYSYSCVTT